MIGFVGPLRQQLEEAVARAAALDRELYHATHELQRLREDVAAGQKREDYWRTRAEKFIDQIALRQGNIAEPTMRDAPGPPRNAVDSAFAALGVASINEDKSRPVVSAVDSGAAIQAVLDATR